MRVSIIALVSAAFAGWTSAYTTPVGANPSGNPTIKPASGEIVPVGSPYTITWTPTTTGTITLVLLRGPSTNILPLYPIVEKIPNTGSYVWIPLTTLEPDTLRYGIQLIVDATGAYQYTPQFGISNPNYKPASSSSSSSSTSPAATAVAAATTSVIRPFVSQIFDGQIQAATAPAAAPPATTTTARASSTAAAGAVSSASAAVTTGVVRPVNGTSVTVASVSLSSSRAANLTVTLATTSTRATLLTSTTGSGTAPAVAAATSPKTAGVARVVGGGLVGIVGLGAVLIVGF